MAGPLVRSGYMLTVRHGSSRSRRMFCGGDRLSRCVGAQPKRPTVERMLLAVTDRETSSVIPKRTTHPASIVAALRGAALWTRTTDYQLPPSPGWTPSYGPVLTAAGRYYFAGNGGTVYFTDDPDGLWSAVLRRKGGRYELVARMPLDPSLN